MESSPKDLRRTKIIQGIPTMHSIWAIAVNTIKQALRLKIAIVFVVLMLILLPVMGATATGDGTVKGRLQTFVSYGLSLTSLLLSLLAIICSIYTMTSDLEQRQIYMVLTKPVRRFELVAGKLLGVILLSTGLLVVFSSLIFAVVYYSLKFSDAAAEELAAARNEFYTARAGLTPRVQDVSKEVLETYKKLERTHQLPAGASENKAVRNRIINQITSQKKYAKRAVLAGQEIGWEFHNIELLDPDESLFIKFKYDVSVNPPDLQIYSRWLVGDDRPLRYGTKVETGIYQFERKDIIRTFREMEVPADAVAADGYLAVRFFNVGLNDTIVFFPPEDGLEVLYKADTFGANYIRAVLIILFRLIFLAALGILAASFLSLPVSILLCLVVLFTGTISGFIMESFNLLGGELPSVYTYTLKPIVQLLPQFDKVNPSKYLVPGRLLSWFIVAKAASVMVILKAGFLLLLALLIFSYREIAKITI
ncbi:MAG: ABC transporter permease [Sedimentisphaerales bacterium]|nr:ABC transporter permease [Sedimentisphaerales bacterium]